MPLYSWGNGLLLFIHIPKVAGTTIENGLANHLIGLLNRDEFRTSPFFKSSPQHFHYAMLAEILELSVIAHKFAVVRHPTRRLLSEYGFRVKYHGEVMPVSEWILQTLRRAKDMPYLFDNHIRPQVEFVADDVSVFRLEDGLSSVSDWLHEASGRTIRPDFSSVDMVGRTHKYPLPKEAVECIEDFYAMDFARFGYNFIATPEESSA